MRKTIGLILLGLGAFLLVAGLVSLLWAPDRVERTPLDVDSVTSLEGSGGKVDTTTGEITSQTLKATSVTRSDSNASDGDVVVFTNFSCLVTNDDGNTPDCPEDVNGEPDPRILSVSQDIFATDRRTALAVNSSTYLPEGTPEHDGLINKWPFNPEEKTYPYWDDVISQAVDATYVRAESVDGVDTLVYNVKVEGAPIEVIEGVPGTYDIDRTLWIDARTGSIINMTFTQQRVFGEGAGDLAGLTALDIELAYTEDEVADNVSDAKDAASQLNLITKTIPMVGLIGGAVAVLGGLFLLMRRRGDSAGATHQA